MTGLLAREVTGDPWASLAAGLVAALNSAMTWFVPIIYLSSTYLVAAVLWAWWRLHRRRRTRDVAVVLGLLVALVFASQEYALMTLLILLLDSTCRAVAPRVTGLPEPWWRGLATFWASAAIVLGSLAVVAIRSPANPLYGDSVVRGSGFLLGFVTPPWSRAADGFRFWGILYLGTAPLAILAATAWGARRHAGFWMLALVAVLLMACGPYVGLHHPASLGPDAAPPGHRPPGAIYGPYWVAMHAIPLMRFFRAAYRWVSVGQILLGVLVAIGLAHVRRRVVRPAARRVLTTAALVAVVALGAYDVRGLRAPVVPARVPDVYGLLADDPEPSALLELPVGLSTTHFANLTSRYMFHQTLHRKFLLDGTVARMPPGVDPLVSRRFTTFHEHPWIKYVIVHRDLLAVTRPLGRAQVETVDKLLATEGTLVRRDGPVEVYRLTTFRPETVAAATRGGT